MYWSCGVEFQPWITAIVRLRNQLEHSNRQNNKQNNQIKMAKGPSKGKCNLTLILDSKYCQWHILHHLIIYPCISNDNYHCVFNHIIRCTPGIFVWQFMHVAIHQQSSRMCHLRSVDLKRGDGWEKGSRNHQSLHLTDGICELFCINLRLFGSGMDFY